jgi:phenylalanyl-tRNA synthetase beta chain
MPTITFSLDDLSRLVGQKLTIKQVENLVEYGKGELKGYDERIKEVNVNFDDTNLPYLWSAEGVARLIRGILGKKIKQLNAKDSSCQVIVDKNIKTIRPYIGAFVAKGHKIDDYLIKQMIQLQEKFCETYGRKREKVAIGVYSYSKIKFPVHYKATDPESVEFVPLEYKRKMTQQEILEAHPKGKEYAWILKDFKKYPILADDRGSVLSFPPIINSNESGKIEAGDQELFIEVTGTDLDAVHLAVNTFAYAFSDRGFDIYKVAVRYPDKAVKTPFSFGSRIKISREQIKGLLGIDLTDKQVKDLAEKAGYRFNNYMIEIPDYRRDIMHPVDVIEDIGIVYGYDKIKELPLVSYTIGETSSMVRFRDRVREMIVGLGFQEIMSPILNNKETLFKKMNIEESNAVEIEEYMSETYSVVRNWLLPVMIEVLSKNAHIEYPQKVFEQGLVTVNMKGKITDYEKVAAVIADKDADFTKIKQVLDFVMKGLGAEYQIQETEHKSFIPGRVGRVSINGKDVAYIGEISPEVLSNWGIEVPVAGFELNLSELLQLSIK